MSGELVQQLPALIGVAVGAIATYAGTAGVERARWRRQQVGRIQTKINKNQRSSE
jgi:hypothetical protein